MRQRLDTPPWEFEIVDVEPREPTNKSPFLFAHGKAFNSEVWIATGIMRQLAERGHRVVAFDVPGADFPHSRSEGYIDGHASEMLMRLLGKIGLPKPIGVFPSLSALRVGFPALERTPDIFSGIVLPAPIEVGALTPPESLPLSALVVWAEGDTVAPVGDALTVANEFDRPVIAIANSDAHAVYTDCPDEFSDLLAWYGEDPDSAISRTAQIYEDGFWHQLPSVEE